MTGAGTLSPGPAHAGPGGRGGPAFAGAAASVCVHDLSVSYAGRRGVVPVLRRVDLALAPGECLAVVGESGCGKSTLLHVLAGLLAPDAGEVLVDGEVVAAAGWDDTRTPGCRAGHAAYLFQRDLLLPWKTVLANTVFAAEVARRGQGGTFRERMGLRGHARRARVGPNDRPTRKDTEAHARAVLDEFGLGRVLEALPRELSGGMRQRVALARTLVLGRKLVLLDEPFGGLDALTRAELHIWLLGVMAAHPATWVLVTHDVREAVLLGDQVAVLAGRPARLEGRVPVTLDRTTRRLLAGVETGEPRDAAGLEPASQTMLRLMGQVHRLLGAKRLA